MRVASLGLLGVVVLSGCFGGSDPLADDPSKEGPDFNDVRPELAAPRFAPPLKLGEVTLGAEPSIVVDGADAVYVTTPLALWRSRDGGKTYEALGTPACDVPFLPPSGGPCPPGFESRDPGLEGGGDGDLAVDAQGRVYWAGLGGGVPVQYSDDNGTTWSKAFDVAEGANSDREWVDARPDGTVYVSWRDLSKNQLSLRASLDRGETWEPVRKIGRDALAGPVVHDPNSSWVYVPFLLDGSVQVARSSDEGATWQAFPIASGGGAGSGFDTSIFPVVAVDARGTLYAVWSVDADALVPEVKATWVPRVYFAASRDQGETWTMPAALSPESRAAVFPWIAAGAPGRVAVVWYENRFGLPNELLPDLWDVALVESVAADGHAPTFLGGHLNTEPIHVGSICSDGLLCTFTARDRSLLDFFEVALRPNGQPVVAWAGDATARMARVSVWAGGVEEGTPLL